MSANDQKVTGSSQVARSVLPHPNTTTSGLDSKQSVPSEGKLLLPGGTTYKISKAQAKLESTFSSALNKLPATDKKLLTAVLKDLETVNGSAIYDRTKPSEIKPSAPMFIPENILAKLNGMSQAWSGTGDIRPRVTLTSVERLQLFLANCDACPRPEYRTKFAMLRVYAVESGWYMGQAGVKSSTGVNDAGLLLGAARDMKLNSSTLTTLKRAAEILPFVAEVIFRTTGHHYISGQVATYDAKYSSILSSCLASDIAGILPAELLYHDALHWVGPSVAYNVMRNYARRDDKGLPDAIRTRKDSAPAGTSVVTSGFAVMIHLKALGYMSAVNKVNRKERKADPGKRPEDVFDIVEKAVKLVRGDPRPFHQFASVYGVQRVDPLTNEVYAAAHEICVALAPILQGYLNSLPNNAPITGILALHKVAMERPQTVRAARTFFRAQGRTLPKSLDELVSKLEPTAATIRVQAEDDEADEV